MKLAPIAALALAALLAAASLYTVDESEVAIVTRFGRPLDGVKEAGLHAKLPAPVDRVARFSRKTMLFDPPQSEYLTEDKKNIVIDGFAAWRIADPLLFLRTVRNAEGAEARLLDLVSSELGAAAGSYPLSSFISTAEGEARLDEIAAKVTARVGERARREYGIDVADFRMNRFTFPPQNTRSVINRMKAERERIARQYRSEGEEEALKIEAEAEQERRAILSKAESEASKIRGDGDAQAIAIYSDAYSRDPEFYKLLRTLESYEKIVDGKTTIILPADSEIMRLLTRGIEAHKAR